MRIFIVGFDDTPDRRNVGACLRLAGFDALDAFGCSSADALTPPLRGEDLAAARAAHAGVFVMARNPTVLDHLWTGWFVGAGKPLFVLPQEGADLRNLDTLLDAKTFVASDLADLLHRVEAYRVRAGLPLSEALFTRMAEAAALLPMAGAEARRWDSSRPPMANVPKSEAVHLPCDCGCSPPEVPAPAAVLPYADSLYARRRARADEALQGFNFAGLRLGRPVVVNSALRAGGWSVPEGGDCWRALLTAPDLAASPAKSIELIFEVDFAKDGPTVLRADVRWPVAGEVLARPDGHLALVALEEVLAARRNHPGGRTAT